MFVIRGYKRWFAVIMDGESVSGWLRVERAGVGAGPEAFSPSAVREQARGEGCGEVRVTRAARGGGGSAYPPHLRAA
ncbi:hypothetical protein NL676_027181 [Syzygium grande]|nr:hypothetical protein NL676_027181 [Syzygium grande]